MGMRTCTTRHPHVMPHAAGPEGSLQVERARLMHEPASNQIEHAMAGGRAVPAAARGTGLLPSFPFRLQLLTPNPPKAHGGRQAVFSGF